MRTTYREIEEVTVNICNMLNKRTGGMYHGRKGTFKQSWNNGGISFQNEGESGEEKLIYLDTRNTYEKLQALIAIRDTIEILK